MISITLLSSLLFSNLAPLTTTSQPFIQSKCETETIYLINSQVKKGKRERAAMTYGYILGQEITLNYYFGRFKSLEQNILACRTHFNANFESAIKSIENYLKTEFGEEGFRSARNEIYKVTNDGLNRSKPNIEQAEEFIQIVNDRANGKIETPILQTILGFEYQSNPLKEMLSGYTQSFTSQNNPKATSSHWKTRLPKSWLAEEGERPHVLKKYTSEYGSGWENIVFLDIDFKKENGIIVPPNMANEFYTESTAKTMIPKNATLIEFKKMTFANIDGGYIEYETTGKRLDLNIKSRQLQFYFLYNNVMHCILCSVSSLEEQNAELALKMSLFKPLFREVANQTVVEKP